MTAATSLVIGNPQDVLAQDGLLKQLTKAVIERCLETELDSHLGYPKQGRQGTALGNTHNGTSQKTMKGEQGHLEIEVPRDRQGTLEPQLVKKGRTRLEGFDEKILAMYARGMTTRDIQAQLQELYGVEVSPTLISNVTEAVMEEVRQWQTRPASTRQAISGIKSLLIVIWRWQSDRPTYPGLPESVLLLAQSPSPAVAYRFG
jgi:transposase-like protein